MEKLGMLVYICRTAYEVLHDNTQENKNLPLDFGKWVESGRVRAASVLVRTEMYLNYITFFFKTFIIIIIIIIIVIIIIYCT
jgi:hypothetical protein